MIVTLIEQHPGFGDWGRRWAPERGFVDEDVDEIERGLVHLPARPVAEDHVDHEGDNYIVSYVLWTKQSGVPSDARVLGCRIYCRYNGKARA